jgi:hypothetical protein
MSLMPGISIEGQSRHAGFFDSFNGANVDGFENGDLTSWDSVIGGSDLVVTTGSAMFGSFGMQALVNDTTRLYVKDLSPVDETHYSARLFRREFGGYPEQRFVLDPCQQ